MKEPNDNLEAYGFSLRTLRDRTELDLAGRPLFQIAIDIKEMRKYGVELEFLDPNYLHYMLEQRPEIKKGAEKARAAGYSPEALEKFKNTVVKVFEEHVLVDIVQRFFKVSSLVAQFYAAKLAYEDTFGRDDEDEDAAQEAAPKKKKPPQIDAKTTKSRR
jgi:hypothetical protein